MLSGSASARLPTPPAALVRRGALRRLAGSAIVRPRRTGRLEGAVRSIRARWSPAVDDDAVARLLTALAAHLRSGSALPTAAAAAAGHDAVGRALTAAVAQHRRGLAFEDAVATWAHLRPSAAVRLAAATLTVGSTTGGELGRACDAAASTLRQRAALRHEVRAQAAQARMSAVVVALAPPAFTVVAAVADPAVGRFLLTTPWGWACLVGGVAADVVGLLWMRAIVARVGR